MPTEYFPIKSLTIRGGGKRFKVSIGHNPNRNDITGINALNSVKKLLSIVNYKSNRLGSLTSLPERVCISANSL